MFILIVSIHILVSLVIVGLVLLQAGKGADIGSAFGGSGSQAVFGSMGTFALSIMSHHRAASIMPASGPAAPAPATPAAPGAPAATPAPAPPAPQK